MFIQNILRRARNILRDPTQQKWFLGHFIGRYKGAPIFEAHIPSYLTDQLPLAPEKTEHLELFSENVLKAPIGPLEIDVFGQKILVDPNNISAIFEADYTDTETLLYLHRFSWVPLLDEATDPSWVLKIWQIWCTEYGNPDESWSWHPYTAAERVINILNFVERHGNPVPIKDTVSILAAHGPAIAGRLEYFGDHHTSNHLANNGRGLFRLGLELGLENCAAMGSRILLEEAKRIFLPSGILRENSSHYHLLVTTWYADAFELAQKYQRPEAAELKNIFDRLLAVCSHLVLPNGLPLIGDVSPDCSPEIILGKIAQYDQTQSLDILRLGNDGWLPFQFKDWQGLWHMAPTGWSHMPGHGHQDCGGFELHFGRDKIFIDVGRGGYGELSEAAHYRSAQVHNTILIDDLDPYPPNKPYYSDEFRQNIAGSPPELSSTSNSVQASHDGYTRLKSVGRVSRKWDFSEKQVSLTDQVVGKGRRKISRLFHTDLSVQKIEAGVILESPSTRYRLSAESGAEISISPCKKWLAYGVSEVASAIEITVKTNLPWSGHIKLERM
jgi:hypothetical protein